MKSFSGMILLRECYTILLFRDFNFVLLVDSVQILFNDDCLSVFDAFGERETTIIVGHTLSTLLENAKRP